MKRIGRQGKIKKLSLCLLYELLIETLVRTVSVLATSPREEWGPPKVCLVYW